MNITMNMNSYEIERDDFMEDEYGIEILYSGWNSDLALVCPQPALPDNNNHMTLPSSLATVDAEEFLKKMYACQR